MADQNEMRLARIETKLDSLSEAITTLARIDERMLNHMETARRLGMQIDDMQATNKLLGDRITALEFSKERIRGGVLVVSALSSIMGVVIGHFWK